MSDSVLQIVGNFGMDVMEALSGTCTLLAMGRVRGLQHLVCDALVAFAVVLLHAVILMCEVRGWGKGHGALMSSFLPLRLKYP